MLSIIIIIITIIYIFIYILGISAIYFREICIK